MHDFALIIPAAGTGSRSGSDVPKQFVELDGVRILARALRTFLDCVECVEVVVAVSDEWRDVALECARGDVRVRPVSGGAERQHSIANALRALQSDVGIVLVHDAARPLVTRALIERVVDASLKHGAALPVVRIVETVKRVDERGAVVQTIPRADLRLAQTPQGFHREVIERAYSQAHSEGFLGTDDASLVEALGETVMTVDGDRDNIKVTVAEDFMTASLIVASRQAG